MFRRLRETSKITLQQLAVEFTTLENTPHLPFMYTYAPQENDFLLN